MIKHFNWKYEEILIGNKSLYFYLFFTETDNEMLRIDSIRFLKEFMY